MISLAIPIYFFRRSVPTEIIGLLSAATTLTYSVSPILLSRVSERLPRKTSVIIAMIGTLISQLIFYISLHPILFLTTRLCEGFIVGLFWTNLQASISDNVYHRHRRLTALYNISWNTGLVLGLVFGAVLTYLINDLEIVFYFAPIFLLVNVLIAVFAFQEPYKNAFILTKPHKEVLQGGQLRKPSQNSGNQPHIDNISFPIYYPFLLIIIYSIVRAAIKFLFPLKSEVLGFDTYTVYLASTFYALAQAIAMVGASSVSIKRFKTIHFIILIPLFIFTPLFGINTNYYFFILLFLITGAITGMLYGISLRLILILNMKHQTSLYSSILESMIGICFLFVPIMTGYLTYINIDLPIYVISLITAILSLILIVFIHSHKL